MKFSALSIAMPFNTRRCLQRGLFLIFTLVTITGYSQITLNEKNAPLGKVLRLIEKQSSYVFLYDEADLKIDKISVEAVNVSLEEALKRCFKGLPVEFTITGNNVLLRKKNIPSPKVSRQAIEVRGRVADENDKPLQGVVVRVINTTLVAVSDREGKYRLKVPDPNAVLIFAFVGFATLEVPVAGQATVNAVMKEQKTDLGEVVVVGYGTQKKSDLTGSVASLKAKDIEQSKSVSFMEAMQGRLSGVQLTSSSGEPGAGVNINIRGANSFTSGVQPLYVIDGVQIDINNGEVSGSTYGNTSQLNPLASLNPADIASIEVLKDASATAIFGSRGANGVVIVTTKSGGTRSSLELNTYLGVASPSKKLQLLGAQDYAAYRYAISPQDPNWATDVNGDGVYDQVKDMSASKSYDWQQLLLRNALAQNYNINYSGGNSTTTFASSFGYLNQQGLVKKNGYERYNLNFKINHKATRRFTISSLINAAYTESKGTATNGGDGPRNYNGLIQNLVLYKPVNVPEEGDIMQDPDDSGLGSPQDFVNYSRKIIPSVRVIANVTGDYKLTRDLSINISTGGVLTNSKDKEWYPSSTSWGYAVNGLAILNTSSSLNWYNTTTLNFKHTYGKYHSLTALLGIETNSYIYETFSVRGQGFDIQTVNAVDNIATAQVLAVPPTTNKYKYNRLSQFGRVNYIYRDKYLLTATLRNDGSSKFGAGNKYALFPSLAFAWRASRESFLKKNDWLSDLKLRTSFGVTGNDRIAAYQSLSGTENAYYAGTSGATLGIAPSILANKNLKWESTYQYNGGIDLSLWNNRIVLTADVYLKQTRDLLINADVAGQGGYMKQWQNIGRVDNKGLELTVNTTNIQKQHFSWSSSFNISFNRNKVVSLGMVNYLPVTITGGLVRNVGRVIKGSPIGTAYGYVFDGIYQTNDFTKQSNGSLVLNADVVKMQSRSAQPGDFKYKDLNGDKVINDDDMTVISDSNPLHYGGFSNTFTYGNFDLSILLQWSYGNDILYAGKYRYEAGQNYYANVSKEYWENRWTADRPSNTHASLTGLGKIETSSYYVEDGSYLRLKNVTLGYNMDQLLKRFGVRGCRLYVTGENLLTWTGYSGFDPEIASYTALLPGIDNISYPRARTITFGLNLKF